MNLLEGEDRCALKMRGHCSGGTSATLGRVLSFINPLTSSCLVSTSAADVRTKRKQGKHERDPAESGCTRKLLHVHTSATLQFCAQKFSETLQNIYSVDTSALELQVQLNSKTKTLCCRWLGKHGVVQQNHAAVAPPDVTVGN